MSAFVGWFISILFVLQFLSAATFSTTQQIVDSADFQRHEISNNRREKCELISGDQILCILSVVFGIGIVRFENGVCNSSSGLEGTCYTRYQCRSVSGFGSGRCAGNIGVCCVSEYHPSITIYLIHIKSTKPNVYIYK